MPMELILHLKKKKGMRLRFLTKSISKLLDRTVYSTNTSDLEELTPLFKTFTV